MGVQGDIGQRIEKIQLDRRKKFKRFIVQNIGYTYKI
jgi:hypothetical protein